MSTPEVDAARTLVAKFTNSDVAYAPATITLKIIEPSKEQLPDIVAGFSNPEVGTYEYVHVLTMSGRLKYKFIGTGGADPTFQAAQSGFVDIEEDDFR